MASSPYPWDQAVQGLTPDAWMSLPASLDPVMAGLAVGEALPESWLAHPPAQDPSVAQDCVYGWAGSPIVLGNTDVLGLTTSDVAAHMDRALCLGPDLAADLQEARSMGPSGEKAETFWYRADHIRDQEVLRALRAKANIFSTVPAQGPAGPGYQAEDDSYAKMLSCAESIVSESAARGAAEGTEPASGQTEDPFQAITGVRIVGQDPESGKWTLELHVTAVVSGFIIGPGGFSIRRIMKKTRAKISSYTEPKAMAQDKDSTRVFIIRGTSKEITQTLKIFLAAVSKYKELSEGASTGQRVDCSQIAEGVRFLYRPPPKAKAQQDAAAQGFDGSSAGTDAAAAAQPRGSSPTA